MKTAAPPPAKHAGLMDDRKILVWVIRAGVAMPVLVPTLSYFIGLAHITNSISAYYFSVSRDLFVMTLTAAGLLLVGYPGREGAVPGLENSRCEFWVSNFAGIAAFLIPLFPMDTKKAIEELQLDTRELPVPAPSFVEELFPQAHGTVHLVSAVIFFTLAMILAFLFSRESAEPRNGRNFVAYCLSQAWSGFRQGWHGFLGRLHNLAGLTLLGGLILAGIGGFILVDWGIYWPEVIMLAGFCFAWTVRLADKRPLR